VRRGAQGKGKNVKKMESAIKCRPTKLRSVWIVGRCPLPGGSRKTNRMEAPLETQLAFTPFGAQTEASGSSKPLSEMRKRPKKKNIAGLGRVRKSRVFNDRK